MRIPQKPGAGKAAHVNSKPGPRPTVNYRPNFIDLIPKELRDRAQWCVWKFVLAKDRTKWTKVPFQARNPKRHASSTDPRTWGTFSEALGAFLKGREAKSADRIDGIGFVFSADDPYVGIDLDNCLELHEDGGLDIKAWAQPHVARLSTYAEISPSGNGIKFIARAEIPGPGHKRGGFGDDQAGAVEMYQQGRYFAITGNRLDDHPGTVEDIGTAVVAIHGEVWPPKPKPGPKPAPAAARRPDLTRSDEDLLAHACEAKGGSELRSLYRGDVPTGKTLSEATAALLCRLAFWTGKDAARMDRMFRASGLMRPKWDESRGGSTWGANEIQGAIDVTGDTYSPPAPRRPGEDPAAPNGKATEANGATEAAPSLDDILSRRPWTDLGNAERLVARHGRDLRFCHPWSKWLVWDGRRWKLDDTGEARRRAKKTVRAILKEAATIEDDDRRKGHSGWQLQSEKRDKLSAMLHEAQSESGIPILPPDMDADPWLFNCRNGTVDLRTGNLGPHRRGDLITQLCDLDYEPDAPCPLWLSTMQTFFKRENSVRELELIDYWQRLCGYCLTGVVRDHVLPVAYGTGSNGKSTILGMMLDVFGSDYAMKCPPDMLMTKKTDAHPTDRADLFRKRLVVAIETEQSRRINETLIKELTGGDAIRARRMREDFWEFKPTHTLIMATNHKPSVRGTDHGIWRRLKLVPFTVALGDDEADKLMPEKLQTERAGILSWFVAGCLEWQARGLDAPPEVTEATADYRREQDAVGAFLAEHTMSGPSLRAKAGEVYKRYTEWATAGNERIVMTLREFGTSIEERGIPKKTSAGVWYLGIGLRDPG